MRLLVVFIFLVKVAYAADAGVVQRLDGDGWLLATDARNAGIVQRWFESPPATGAVRVRVPSVIQEGFPGYHGVAWYWRDVPALPKPPAGQRLILRFRQVDYLAEVWLNGRRVGSHEGGEGEFEFDVSDVAEFD